MHEQKHSLMRNAYLCSPTHNIDIYTNTGQTSAYIYTNAYLLVREWTGKCAQESVFSIMYNDVRERERKVEPWTENTESKCSNNGRQGPQGWGLFGLSGASAKPVSLTHCLNGARTGASKIKKRIKIHFFQRQTEGRRALQCAWDALCYSFGQSALQFSHKLNTKVNTFF